MRSLGRGLFEHYKAYHSYGPPRLKYAGYVGAISYTLFYFLRFTRSNSQLYDDLVPRLVAVSLLALLAVENYWPERLKRHYVGYSYAALLYCLPCFTVLTALQRGGGAPAISNAFIILCFLVLLTDWRNTLVMLFAGAGMAAVVYAATSPNPKVPMDFVAQLPAFALIVIGGNLFKFSTEQIDAERKLRATQALAGTIAHEMRNPLSQIRYNLESMQQALPPPTATVQAQTLAGHEVQALYRHLAESELAVKRGLQVIAMTLDEVSAKPVDTSAVQYLSAAQATHKAVQEFAFQNDADRGKVTVRVLEDFTFRGVETAYLFVVFNLIKNALHYLEIVPGMQVTVTVRRHQVLVRDSGPGIRPEAHAALFQPFSSSGKSGGTGLGLAYCRRVMLAFGGEIGCDSVPGEYTLFTLRFPPIDEEQFEAHRAEVLGKARAAFAGKRLLIVDDDAPQRLITAHKLQPLGAQLDQAADGQRALEALARQRYDLILLDLNMPVLDGYKVTERIRQGDVPANRGVCIVAHTSEPAHLARLKTQKAGIDGFVNKPCDQLPLVQVLLDAIQQRLPQARPEAGLAGRRVVLADDSPYNRKAVAAYLKHAGVAVLEAGHGQAVLDHLEASSECDAILMDLNMPGMNGVDTTQAIRRGATGWRNVPIIALTAHSGRDAVHAARAAGMDDFVTKPVEASVLYAKLGKLIHNGAPPRASNALPAARAGAADRHGPLLNLERLDSFCRIGMLQELLNDYLPEIGRLVDTLELTVAKQDLKASLEALHSLLGMSGEAGAQALYALVREFYVPMVERQTWPADQVWLAQIKVAAQRAEKALKAYQPPMQSTVAAG
jgi:two-component system, CAI-1 autoinducer sensor kinase/phosphatase CqsS